MKILHAVAAVLCHYLHRIEITYFAGSPCYCFTFTINDSNKNLFSKLCHYAKFQFCCFSCCDSSHDNLHSSELNTTPWRRIGEWRCSSTHSWPRHYLGWVVSFTPRPLYPRKRAPGTHWIGGWVGPRAVLDAVVKRKIPTSPPPAGKSTKYNIQD
jgi:hypothetical protein